MKRHLRALILRARGGHSFDLVLARLDEMSEEEMRQWYRLIKNIESDAKAKNNLARYGLR